MTDAPRFRIAEGRDRTIRLIDLRSGYRRHYLTYAEARAAMQGLLRQEAEARAVPRGTSEKPSEK